MNGVDKLIGIICEIYNFHPNLFDTPDKKRAIIRIAADLDALFHNEGYAQSWMNSAIEANHGGTPRQAILDGNVIAVEAWVAHMSGR